MRRERETNILIELLISQKHLLWLKMNRQVFSALFVDQLSISVLLKTGCMKNIAQGGYQTVQTVAVHQAARGLGLGSQLLAQLTTRAQAAEREAIALTCLADRIPFYEKNGFTNLGPSQSTHAGEQWYNMEKILQHA